MRAGVEKGATGYTAEVKEGTAGSEQERSQVHIFLELSWGSQGTALSAGGEAAYPGRRSIRAPTGSVICALPLTHARTCRRIASALLGGRINTNRHGRTCGDNLHLNL